MRNTTKAAFAVAAAVAATLAMGASTASALQWTTPPNTTSSKLEGALTLQLGNTGRTATCANVNLLTALHNNGGNAQWQVGGPNSVGCVEAQYSYASTMSIGHWWLGSTAQSGGTLTMTQAPSPTTSTSPFWAAGTFYSATAPFTMDVINGNSTTSTKVVFDQDVIGSTGGHPVRATGELTLRPSWAGYPGTPTNTLITLN